MAERGFLLAQMSPTRSRSSQGGVVFTYHERPLPPQILRRMMHILVGHTGAHDLVARLKELGWGRIMCRDKPNPFEGERWGLDNGAYSAYLKGEELNLEAFTAKTADVAPTGCMMAVIPDLVGRGDESLDYSLKALEALPDGFPWYLAVQDGMEIQPLWERVCSALEDERIKGIFLGGTNQFKVTATTWRHTADMLGLKFHYGRAGTPWKVAHAQRVQADSLDSSFPLWTKQRWGIFERAVAGTLPQLMMDLVCSEFSEETI